MTASLEDWLAQLKKAEALVLATNPTEIAKLEAQLGLSQNVAVAHMLESTDWGVERFPQLQNGNGDFEDRLAALRASWDDWKSTSS
ncbi:MAG: hypothetical protein J7521_15720 [Caulobacter sp.]|nr:hypothetical protein [Caulobacter sp.]